VRHISKPNKKVILDIHPWTREKNLGTLDKKPKLLYMSGEMRINATSESISALFNGINELLYKYKLLPYKVVLIFKKFKKSHSIFRRCPCGFNSFLLLVSFLLLAYLLPLASLLFLLSRCCSRLCFSRHYCRYYCTWFAGVPAWAGVLPVATAVFAVTPTLLLLALLMLLAYMFLLLFLLLLAALLLTKYDLLLTYFLLLISQLLLVSLLP